MCRVKLTLIVYQRLTNSVKPTVVQYLKHTLLFFALLPKHSVLLSQILERHMWIVDESRPHTNA